MTAPAGGGAGGGRRWPWWTLRGRLARIEALLVEVATTVVEIERRLDILDVRSEETLLTCNELHGHSLDGQTETPHAAR